MTTSKENRSSLGAKIKLVTAITGLIAAMTGLIVVISTNVKGCNANNKTEQNIDSINNLLPPTDKKERFFNTNSRDLATVLVANDSKNPCGGGYGIGCWQSSIKAEINDIISVQIYYHNCSEKIQHNVSLKVNLNTDNDSIHAIYGIILINGKPDVTSTAKVLIKGSGTLVFIPASVTWYPDQNREGFAELYHDENMLFSENGLSIGDIVPGGQSQGTLVVNFKVK